MLQNVSEVALRKAIVEKRSIPIMILLVYLSLKKAMRFLSLPMG